VDNVQNFDVKLQSLLRWGAYYTREKKTQNLPTYYNQTSVNRE